MWMVVNVEANYLDTGETLVEYPEGPFPVTVESNAQAKQKKYKKKKT